MKTMNTHTEIRVYVGTYAKYNSGSIAGAWLDLQDYADKDEFLAACADLHKDEEDPELMFQDYDGPRAFYSECSIDERAFEYAEADEHDQKVWAAYLEIREDATLEDAQDAFAGIFDSGAAFAENIAEDCGEIPKDLPSWIVIDWEASWGCNLRFDYVEVRFDGDSYFFRNS